MSTHSSATDGDAQDAEAPKIEALFLIRFDKKVGYTIAWKRTSSPSLALDNAVEFKSLPSGLHAQQSDLVYFTHEGYAGLGAFAQGSAGAEDRNANFVSVGVLVKKDGEYGRLGRAWLVAGRLEALAKGIADGEGVDVLEGYWEECMGAKGKEKEGGKANGDKKTHSRARATSTASAIPHGSDERLPPFHPALSILTYIDVFGPLVFRLQQAALLRKRILFVGAPPVRAMCDFVYIISLLSSLTSHSADLLLPGPTRLPTLFSVGVHDIPELEKASEGGWAACTTDEIIATKSKLYDIVVDVPQEGQLPRIRTSGGDMVRASQRDSQRWKMLQRALAQHGNSGQEVYQDEPGLESDEEPLISKDDGMGRKEDIQIDDSLIEPTTWSRLAYSGFMWWASAGERDLSLTSERELDRDLLSPLLITSNNSSSIELELISYFHRLTSTLVEELNRVIDSEGSAGYDEENEEEVVIGGEVLGGLGLDSWSEADRAFVGEFGAVGWGRDVVVRGREVECCGVRVPVL